MRLLTRRDWVHRRVDKASYVDPTTLRRTRSVDFTLPADLTSSFRSAEGRPMHLVPLAIVNKWRLAAVDVRDEHGASAPFVGRTEHGPLAASALITVAHWAMGDKLPPISEMTIPPQLELELRRIANGRVEEALQVCESLIERRSGEDLATAAWRTTIATNVDFMSLAWELARGFFAMPPGRRRRLVPLRVPGPRGLRRHQSEALDAPEGRGSPRHRHHEHTPRSPVPAQRRSSDRGAGPDQPPAPLRHDRRHVERGVGDHGDRPARVRRVPCGDRLGSDDCHDAPRGDAGCLAAFAARAPDSAVVSRMTSGLRLFALAPGVLAFAAAAATVAFPTSTFGKVVLCVIAILAVLVAGIWGAIGHLTRHPKEQWASQQGPSRTRDDERLDGADAHDHGVPGETSRR